MNPFKSKFIELCIAGQALRFGEFTLKSGRVSPYFFNAGLFNRGQLLGRLAQCYAQMIVEQVIVKAPDKGAAHDFMLYGPAYKGIPLVAATALKLFDNHNLDIGYAFNRKEAKDHGEGGSLIGAPVSGNVVIIDDVITAGTSIAQSVSTIKAAGATPHSVVIALDRQEIADHREQSAVRYVEKVHGIPVYSIIDLHDLIDYLNTHQSASQHAAAIRAYRDKYGVV